jgi:UDP-3-O-acyl N-acetylglucosamine deacetylase
VRRLNYRYERTLARPAEVEGVGYLTGAHVRMRLVPAPASTGVVFVRTDLGARAIIPAAVEHVSGTQRRVTLGTPPVCVGLVEHVLAALAGMHIDNCLIELNAPEAPGLDGSAQGFVDAIETAGVCLQPARRSLFTVEAPVIVRQQGATLALHPANRPELRATYFLDHGPFVPPGQQSHTLVVTPETFAGELACCRTFLLEKEALEFKRQGLGKNTTLRDLLVFGIRGPIDNKLRFANEPARHKILDLIGDLSLIGTDLCGHLVAYRSGHPLNLELARALKKQLGGSVEQQKVA